MSVYPFPHGTFFGVFLHDANAFDGQGGMRKLEGEWTSVDGRWCFTALDELDLPTSLKGYGDNPKEAVISCLRAWEFSNGGSDSTGDMYRQLLDGMEEYFGIDGYPIRAMLSEES